MSVSRTAPLLALLFVAAPLGLSSTAQASHPLSAFLEQTVFGTGIEQELRVRVSDEFGTPITTAELQLGCWSGCDVGDLQPSPDDHISGNGAFGSGDDGLYIFWLEPLAYGSYYVEVVVGDSTIQLTFDVVEARWEFYDVQLPWETGVGERVEVYALAFNSAPIDREFEATLLVDGEWSAVRHGWVEAYQMIDLDFAFTAMFAGDVEIQIEMDDGEASGVYGLTVLPLAKAVSADITASPLFSSTLPIVFENARDLSRAQIRIKYDPALVEVRSVDTNVEPGFAGIVDHDPEAGEMFISVAAIVAGYSGNFTVANIEWAAVEHHNTDSSIELDVWNYERVYGYGYRESTSAHFHGSLLGTTGDEVLGLI